MAKSAKQVAAQKAFKVMIAKKSKGKPKGKSKDDVKAKTKKAK